MKLVLAGVVLEVFSKLFEAEIRVADNPPDPVTVPPGTITFTPGGIPAKVSFNCVPFVALTALRELGVC